MLFRSGLRACGEFGPLAAHVRFAERASHRLALQLFHGAVRYQTQLAFRQQLLGRLVEIGAELFAIVASCARAQQMLRNNSSDRSPFELADLFCRQSRQRVEELFRRAHQNQDRQAFQISQAFLDDQYIWLEQGIVGTHP